MAEGKGNTDPTNVVYDHDALNEEIEKRLTYWFAPERTEAEQQAAMFGLCWWVADIYGDRHCWTDEFDGAELPEALRPLVRNEFLGEEHFAGGNTTQMQSRYDHLGISPTVPGWDELYARYPVFEDLVDAIRSSPHLLAAIKPGKLILRPEVVIDFKPHFSYGWGMWFTVGRNATSLSIYGKPGQTQAASDFVATYHDKEVVVQHTVAALAQLMVRHFEFKRQAVVDVHALARLDSLLAGMFMEGVDPRKVKESTEGFIEVVLDARFDEDLL